MKTDTTRVHHVRFHSYKIKKQIYAARCQDSGYLWGGNDGQVEF